MLTNDVRSRYMSASNLCGTSLSQADLTRASLVDASLF
ncbi:MAG: pentapeptide repeat-containing protein [Chloroflexota bacterium]